MLDLLMARVRARVGSDRGATMVEYGLMVALIAIVAAVAVVTVGQNLLTIFTDIANCLIDPGTCPGGA